MHFHFYDVIVCIFSYCNTTLNYMCSFLLIGFFRIDNVLSCKIYKDKKKNELKEGERWLGKCLKIYEQTFKENIFDQL